MFLNVTPSVTHIEPQSHAEFEALEVLLKVQDPNRKKDYEFKSGRWDGYHNFTLNTTEGVAIYTGMLPWFLERAKEADIELDINGEYDDKGEEYIVPRKRGALLKGIKFRKYQRIAIKRAVERKRGVFSIPPRGGKTIIEAGIASALDRPSLLLVDRDFLLVQHYNEYQDCGLEVGAYGSPDSLERDLSKKHIIAMVQSVTSALRSKDPEVLEMLQSRDVIMADEAHHTSGSDTWKRIFMECPASYRFGFSGTPFKTSAVEGSDFNPLDFWLIGCCGPALMTVKAKYLQERGYLAESLAYMVKVEKPWISGRVTNYQSIYKQAVVDNPYRNMLAAKIIKRMVKHGRRVLALVVQIEHGKTMLRALDQIGVPALFSAGGGKLYRISEGQVIQEGDGKQALQDLKDGKLKVLVGSSIFDEGINVPSLDGLVILSGGRAEQRTVQRVYRGLTASAGKGKSVIVDFYDETHFYLIAQSKKRIQTYDTVGVSAKVIGPRNLSNKWKDELI
jgi:superfamily II DNA or RNA helicase